MSRWWSWLLILILISPVLAQSPSARNKFKVGRGEFSKQRYDRAIPFFEQAIKEDEGYLDAHYMLGLCYLGLANYPKAEEKLTLVVARDPQFLAAHQYLGQVLVAAKKYDAAREHFVKMLKVPGGAVTAHYCLGVVAYNEKKLAQAEASWREALRLDPKDARSHNNLGVMRSAEGKSVEALTCFQTAAKLNPDNVSYLLNEGLENLSLGRQETARKIFQRVMDKPGAPLDLACLAAASKAKMDNKWKEALDFCERGLNQQAENTRLWMLKGEVLEKLARPAEAREAYQKAFESDPNVVAAEKALQRLEPPPSPSPSPTSTPVVKPADAGP